jgi:2-polyprenyl-6-methoxyphenol hydroxylase-like FAD-dependent oxidoreductase
VRIHFEHEITDLAHVPQADVVVAADGAGSVVRRAREQSFGTRIEPGRNKYVWLATPHVFDAMTFGFVPTEAGWIWFHAYGYSEQASTFIVECSPETWNALGFPGMDTEQNLRTLERIFARHLDGERLVSHSGSAERLPWLSFRTLTNATWYVDNMVLLGDAAHTAHFTIGSGTRLGMEDAIALADSLHEHDEVRSAFVAYERERQLGMVRPQREARLSATWFENVHRYATLDAPRFYASLRLRHSALVHRIPPRLHYGLYQAAQRVPLSRAAYRWATMRRPRSSHDRGELLRAADQAQPGDT